MIERIKADWAKCSSCIGYIKRRMGERTTWAAIAAGIVAASALELPWSAASLVVAVIMALLPEKPTE